jgi:PAS domain S-box-containing protein
LENSLSQSTAWTQQEQDALRLRVIADTLPAYVAYVDPELRYAMANRMYVEQFRRDGREIVGRTVAEVLGSSFENIAWRLRAALRGEAQLFESPMRTVEGDRYLLVRHIPDRDVDGRVRGVIVHGIDITERKRGEQVLLETEKLAAVGRLASSIAHEINNPLEST